jgi:hypothetical protein
MGTTGKNTWNLRDTNGQKRDRKVNKKRDLKVAKKGAKKRTEKFLKLATPAG